MTSSRQSPPAELPADGPVLMVSTSFPRREGDAAGQFVARLAASIARRRVPVVVLAPHDRGLPTSESMGEVRVRRVRYFLPPALQRLAYGSGIPSNLRRRPVAWLNLPVFLLAFLVALVRHGRRSRLIHAHWGVPGALAVAGRALHRRPVVVTVHGSDLHPAVRPPAVARLTRFAVRRADVVLTPSEDFRRRCLEMGAEDCRFVPHGLEGPDAEELEQRWTERLDRARRGAPPRVVSVGRLVPERRHALLLDALAGITPAASGAEVVLVGEGPEREALERRARRLSPAWRVRFAGQVATREVGVLLADADLYVSATTAETFGLATLEAAAFGLPVVTTAVGYPSELLGPDAARVVEPDNAAALRTAVASLLDDVEARVELGRRARGRLDAAGLSWRAAADATLAAYRSALERSLR